MDKTNKRRNVILTICSLILVVVAIICVVTLLINHEEESRVRQERTITGNVNFESNGEMYVQEVRLQEGNNVPEELVITQGNIKEFQIEEIGKINSEDITMYIDVINLENDIYTASASWTEEEMLGVEYNMPECIITAGTEEDIQAERDINGTIILEIDLVSQEELDLRDITITIDEAQKITDYEFEIDEEEKTVTITQYNGMDFDVEIPNTISAVEGEYIVGSQYRVVRIDNNAFSDNFTISNITIPENVESIGEQAFSDCQFLMEIRFAENSKLERIEDYAFTGDYMISSIIIPESVTNIGKGVFENCDDLREVEFKNTDGWKVYTENTEQSLDKEEVANKETIASYLTNEYKEYNWQREEI